ncbi:hypothetical protein T440DRAFT_554593 [Plenodomus tracheiphilus IPT5]|uniref:NACHT domain-containing protein n=1 Tax=Plenodomus tracheiphilus IPT5 TaxID=1408161 RepID=A0A6A7BAK4_9PLEO|nr:hypothetical protein T440DRAFT_554593 [Plenodomus tracheiphilus IPT5]
MVQQTSPVALVWGCLRFLVDAVGSFTSYFDCLSSTLQQIGDKLQTCQSFKEIHSNWKPFGQRLTEIYYHVLLFLFKLDTLFRKSPLRIFGKAILKTFKQEFQESLSSISRHTTLLDEQITFLHHRTVHIERRRKLMEWLAPVNLDNDLARWWARTTKGTNRWFLDHETYTNWRDGQADGSVLWLTGRAGVGKTFLAASIVQDLRDHMTPTDNLGLGYFFFDSSQNSRSTLLEASATLIAQLAGDRERIPSDVLDLYERAARYGRSKMCSSDKPLSIITNLLNEYQRAYLIFDGVDESAEAALVVREFLAFKDNPKTRILFVSRDTLDTRNLLAKSTMFKLMPTLVQDDIDVFLRAELSHLAEYFEQDDLADVAFDRLSSAACGSFLWAHLVLQTLRKAPNVFEFLSMTTQLPKDLESIYEATLQSLDAETTPLRDLGKLLLRWVCFARRPLRWKELQHALCFDIDDKTHHQDRLPFKNSVLRLCSPLLEYDTITDEFHPVHWSVCEFLAPGDCKASRLQNTSTCPDDHSYMLNVCLSNLMDPEVVDTVHVQHDRSPLLEYATLHWCDHLFQAQPSKELYSILKGFILIAPYRRVWIARYVLLQMSAYPLQVLLKRLRAIHAWLIAKYINQPEASFDILEDVFETMFVLSTDRTVSLPGEVPCSAPSFSHFEKMMIVRDLARTYTLAGRIPDALKWLNGAVKKAKDPFERLPLVDVWILNSLGIMYDQQKDFRMSVDTQLEALALQQCELGPDHLDVVWTMNELGRIYRHLGLLMDAENMHTQVLSILKLQFKEDDPQIVWTKGTLGRTYRYQGRIAEALTLHKQVLTAQIESIGENHCHTLWTKSDIARCVRDQGKVSEALQLFLNVVEGRTKVLGELHADTLWSINDVGLILSLCGQRNEAKASHERALRGQFLSLGRGHEHTVWTQKILDEWIG